MTPLDFPVVPPIPAGPSQGAAPASNLFDLRQMTHQPGTQPPSPAPQQPAPPQVPAVQPQAVPLQPAPQQATPQQGVPLQQQQPVAPGASQ